MSWFRSNPSITQRLAQIFTPGLPKAQAAERLDVLQRVLRDLLVTQYRDETFAQLFSLKLTNLAAGRYHLANRHTKLFSHPVQVMVDPANACQLACPACVHSTNKAYSDVFDWPRVTLPMETYEAYLSRFGPFAFCASLYNYGEPLLNKHFSEIVRMSKEYLLYTITSTNLSLPVINADAIVESGLDYMILSIDGTSQDTYGRYRKNGKLDLVLSNLAKLVAAKRRTGSRTPHLVWQFLTFEHNQHQVPEARRLAKELGADELHVATPFSVESDDPSIHAVKLEAEGTYVLNQWDGKWCSPRLRGAVHKRAASIDAAFARSWHDRWKSQENGPDQPVPDSSTCWWQYFNTTLDGAGRVMPCCMAPDKGPKKLVFTKFASLEHRDGLDIVNSEMATLARLAFAQPEAYRQRASELSPAERPYCASCRDNPSSPYNPVNIRNDIRAIDEASVLPADVLTELTAWV
jgi:MoaA/NifB/PqqE/SkfB family radical SAM enzyme